jgi:Alpha galactosidase C-terminal beta sandwich domain
VQHSWSELGLSGDRYAVRDLWEAKNLGNATDFHATLGPHGVAFYKLHSLPAGD